MTTTNDSTNRADFYARFAAACDQRAEAIWAEPVIPAESPATDAELEPYQRLAWKDLIAAPTRQLHDAHGGKMLTAGEWMEIQACGFLGITLHDWLRINS